MSEERIQEHAESVKKAADLLKGGQYTLKKGVWGGLEKSNYPPKKMGVGNLF